MVVELGGTSLIYFAPILSTFEGSLCLHAEGVPGRLIFLFISGDPICTTVVRY